MKSLQVKLDELIVRYKGQPVGSGYIDIIVSRDSYIHFINELSQLNLAVEAISWWCHCTRESENLLGCPHGMGGPKSRYYEGWFSERADWDKMELEATELSNYDTIKRLNDRAIIILKNKQTITYADGNYQIFTRDKCLTPGIWIKVPDDWKNSFT